MKPENILLKDDICKLGDFGVIVDLDEVSAFTAGYYKGPSHVEVFQWRCTLLKEFRNTIRLVPCDRAIALSRIQKVHCLPKREADVSSCISGSYGPTECCEILHNCQAYDPECVKNFGPIG